jgi:hypothetical protein
MTKMCLANGGKHRWKLRDDSMLGRVRECRGCGHLQQRVDGKWKPIGSTRWVPLTPAERERNA